MKKLGEVYRDEVSGFEGMAVAQTEYLYGKEFDVGLEPTSMKDGKPMGVFWFRESRLTGKQEKKIGLGAGYDEDDLGMVVDDIEH